jgi:linoleoyl-CoA desaturase
VRFDPPRNNGFWRALNAEIGPVMRAPFAPPAQWAKGTLYLALVAVAYGWLMSGPASVLATLAAYSLFNLAALLLVLNLGHDGAHDALTPSRLANRVICEATFALLGIDGHLWRMRHVLSHHVFPNINGCDADIDHNPILRLSPNHPWKRRHRWQHLYALPFYMTVQLHAIFVQDAIYIRQKQLANLRGIRHSPARLVGFAALKGLYFTALLALPIALSPLPWLEVVLAYGLATAVASLAFVLPLVGTHFADCNVFPEPAPDGRLGCTYVEHVLASSLDWSPTSRLATFLIGGLNSHVAHHLFPRVSHAHYRRISSAIGRLAAHHGVDYHCTNLAGIVAAHFRHLQRLGERPAFQK